MGTKVKGLGGCWMVLLLSVSGLAASSSDLALVEAVKKGDQAAVRSLVEQHADVNARQADGATALMWAAHQDNLEIAELLIRAGADANAANDYGATPLWLACSRGGGGAMVEKLLKAGADPNAALLSGETALMTCARTGNVEAVKLLLAHGADVSAKELRRGQTALTWAVAEKHPEVARVLIEHGADVHARSNSGFTPLLFAAREGDLELVRILLAAGANVNEASPEDGSALVVASASGHEALSIFLLDEGADPNAADGYGVTPLHYAVQRAFANLGGLPYSSLSPPPPNLSAVEYTLLRLPPPNMPELAKALLTHGANPNARIVKDYGRRAPFPNFAQMTLVGATPFFLAAGAVDPRLMRLLLASGADPLLGARGGVTPLMVAAGMGRVQDFLEGEERNALEAVKLTAELGADVKAANVRGQTALHAAAYAGADTIIQFLADKGADVDARDEIGQTPFTVAMAIVQRQNDQGGVRFHESTANLLLKLGATRRTKQDVLPYTSDQRVGNAVRYMIRGECEGGARRCTN